MSFSEKKSFITSVVVIGASGFFGKNLLNKLCEYHDVEVRVLVHKNKTITHSNIKFIEGDLLNPDSLVNLFSKGCVVINLAYLSKCNFEAATNLAEACAKYQVKRLIHCSTAVVVGRVKSNWVNETTVCNPITEYELTKLKIEDLLLKFAVDKFEVTVLRPTAVFGSEGKNLLKLAHELLNGNKFINYIKSSFFAYRSMNLVCIENVIAALIFLACAEKVDNEIYIISDDTSLRNNYRDVENHFLGAFGKSYFLPRFFVPEFFLKVIFYFLGRSNLNPSVKYSDAKLTALGFKKPQNFETALNDFSIWYKKHNNL